MEEDLVSQVKQELSKNANTTTQNSNQRFFKEGIQNYGMKASIVHKIAKSHVKELREKTKEEVFNLCEELWKSGLIEETLVACDWSYAFRKNYVPGDFRTFKNWLALYVSNWASCDTFCNHTMGAFIMMYPKFITELKEFTLSDNRWLRRAAAVSLIVPVRKGAFLPDVLEISDKLIYDQDDLVQKGYGWLLKVASKNHQDVVFNYVMDNKTRMPRTALRYAIEKMPPELKELAMRK